MRTSCADSFRVSAFFVLPLTSILKCGILYLDMEAIGTSDGKNYTTIPRVMGGEMCCLKAVVEETTQKYGEFIIPDRVAKNERSIYYEVIKIGSDVTELTGVREGDFVFVDALARFADTYPISFINCRNILFMTDSEGKTVKARKYRMIARIVEPSSESGADGIIRLTGIDPYAEVVSIGEGCEDRGYKVGDRLSVSSNADLYMFGGVKYFDYDWRVPMFKFDDGYEQGNMT